MLHYALGCCHDCMHDGALLGLHFLGLQQGFDQLVGYAEGHHGTLQLQLFMFAP